MIPTQSHKVFYIQTIPGSGVDMVHNHIHIPLSRIFTQVFGNDLEGISFIQRVFNVDTVIKGKMFLVTGNIVAH
mgnify:CR=1